MSTTSIRATQFTTSVDGTELAYEVTGSGPALVLVDGALCSRAFGPSAKLAALLARAFLLESVGDPRAGEAFSAAVAQSPDAGAVPVVDDRLRQERVGVDAHGRERVAAGERQTADQRLRSRWRGAAQCGAVVRRVAGGRPPRRGGPRSPGARA